MVTDIYIKLNILSFVETLCAFFVLMNMNSIKKLKRKKNSVLEKSFVLFVTHVHLDLPVGYGICGLNQVFFIND